MGMDLEKRISLFQDARENFFLTSLFIELIDGVLSESARESANSQLVKLPDSVN